MAKTSDDTLRAPADVSGKRPAIKDIAKRTLDEIKDDDVPGLAAEIAYHFVFAIPPMLIFLIALAAAVNNFTDVPVATELRTMIDDHAPEDMQPLLTSLVDKAVDQVSGAALFGLLSTALVALWSGSNGIATLMKAFNRAYDVTEERSFFRQKLAAIGLTVLMSVLVILAFALFVFGEQIGTFVADQAGLGDAFVTVWQILRWPMAILFIMFLLAVLYYAGPNVEQSFRWISPGSVVATLLWVAIVYGFSIYITFADPGSAYGAVGSVVVLLFFMYLSGIAFVIGAEVNAVLARRYDPETVKDLAENPQKVADTETAVEMRQRRAGMVRNGGDPRPQGGAEPVMYTTEAGAGDGMETGAASSARPRRAAGSGDGERPGIVERLAVGAAALGLAMLVRRLRKPNRG